MIPLSADEIVPFTPPSLANLATPPVFLLRPVTGRDARAFRRACMEEGVVFHGPEELRAEQLRGLRQQWDEAEYETGKAMLQGIWDAIDQGVEVDAGEVAAAAALEASLSRVYQPIRIMSADNTDFNATAPRIALTLFLVGWRNIDVPYRRAAGRVPVETIDALEAALLKAERQAVDDGVEGVEAGKAFVELWAHVLTTMNLTTGERQDFQSPSSSASTPAASRTEPTAAAVGSSTAAPTTKAPRARSRKINAT